MAHYAVPIRLWMYVDRAHAKADNFKHRNWNSPFLREGIF